LTFGIQSCKTTRKENQYNYRNAIEQINKKFQDAYKNKNDKAIKALYTDGATMVMPIVAKPFELL
jgi:ketosteroid isomerase-like protein